MHRYLIRFFASFWMIWRYALSFSSSVYLVSNKKVQMNRYYNLRKRFAKQYRQIPVMEYSGNFFITPLWKVFNKRAEKALLPYPSRHFLKNPIILRTMFDVFSHLRADRYLTELVSNYPRERLEHILEEDPVGGPFILRAEYRTSYTSIQHTFHLHQFFSSTGTDPSSIKTVIEWGGGYGRFALILMRFTKQPLKYIIVDTPLFCALQWLYMSSVLGEDKVSLITKPGMRIDDGRICILPISLFDHYALSSDLFISTWALSESGKAAQRAVADRNWFNAKHILLSYKENDNILPDSELAGDLAKSEGAKRYPVPSLPGHFYVFR